MNSFIKFSMIVISTFILASCQKDVVVDSEKDMHNSYSEEIILAMPAVNYDSMFVQTLETLLTRFESINNDLNGAFSNHIAEINDLTKTEIISFLDSIGVANVNQLITLIETAGDYEEQILSAENQEYVEALISNISGADQEIAGRPFWGVSNDCEWIGDPFGGIGGSDCYQARRCKKYRFWIHWGGWDTDPYVPVPCP